MKILLITSSTSRGGVEEYALRIGTYMVQKQHKVYASFPERLETKSLISDFSSAGMIYEKIKLSEKKYRRLSFIRRDLPNILATIRLIWKTKPNAVFIIPAHTPHCFGSILACALTKTPTLVRFGLVPWVHSFPKSIKRLYQWANKLRQQWLTVSYDNMKLVSESFCIPIESLKCIHNGTKPILDAKVNAFSHSDPQRSEFRKRLGLSENCILALTVARLDPQKGYTDLIPAIPKIVSKFPNIRFIWIGEGEQEDVLRQLIDQYKVNDYVLFMGYRRDVPEFLSNSDLFLFPTKFEGSPSALLEAMAHGVPIVTSNASGISEQFESSKHGLMFQKGDQEELLSKILWALNNQNEMLNYANSAKKHIEKNFTIEQTKSKTLTLLENVEASKQTDERRIQ